MWTIFMLYCYLTLCFKTVWSTGKICVCVFIETRSIHIKRTVRIFYMWLALMVNDFQFFFVLINIPPFK